MAEIWQVAIAWRGLADIGLADVGLAEAGLADAGLADAGLADAGFADKGRTRCALDGLPPEDALAGLIQQHAI